MEKVKLGEVATLITKGTTPTSVGYKFEETGINFIKIEAISETGELVQHKFSYISEECNNKLKRSKLYENDILFSIAGAIGKVAIVKKDMLPANTNQALAIIRIDDKYNKKYLRYILSSSYIKKQYNRKKQGVAQLNLSLNDISELEIPIVDLQEQNKIVENLDKVQKLIDKNQKQINLLEELVKSQFDQMFGDPFLNDKKWKTNTIGNSCILKSGNSLSAEVENEGGDVLYVKVGDMNLKGNEKYITTSSHKVTEKTAGKGIFELGTILFPKRGGAIGTNKKRLTNSKVCADLNIMGVTPIREIISEYLFTYFLFIDLGTLNNGSSVPQINNKDIEPLIIQVPPIELQNQFAEIVKQIDKQKAIYQKNLETAQELMNKLMDEYFNK